MLFKLVSRLQNPFGGGLGGGLTQVLIVHWMSTECPLNVHWMFTECPLNVHWMFTTPETTPDSDSDIFSEGMRLRWGYKQVQSYLMPVLSTTLIDYYHDGGIVRAT
jgi:hypothetical protein